MKITSENMFDELNRFGAQYDYPVYCMICGGGGFLSSGKFDKWGFFAVDSYGEALYVTIHSLMGAFTGSEGAYCKIYTSSIEKLKIRKALLLNSYTIDITYRSEDGKKKYISLSIAGRVKGFDEQGQNLPGLVNMLRRWQN